MNRSAILLVLALAACGTGGSADTCDAPGCFCADDADVAICAPLGMTPFCCTNSGGHPMDCGQAADCVVKPGLDEPGASGANWCCPAPKDGGQ